MAIPLRRSLHDRPRAGDGVGAGAVTQRQLGFRSGAGWRREHGVDDAGGDGAARYHCRMPKLSINIDVDDLDRGAAFYEAAAGLRPARRFGDSVVELIGGEVPVYLLLKAPATPPFPGADGRRDYARHWTPVHVDFVVREIEEALAGAVAAGARVESEIESYRWGRVVLLSDPFGNGFCFVELDVPGFDEMTTPYVRPEDAKASAS